MKDCFDRHNVVIAWLFKVVVGLRESSEFGYDVRLSRAHVVRVFSEGVCVWVRLHSS